MTTAAQIGQLYAICVPHTIVYTGTPGASADVFALERAYNFDDGGTPEPTPTPVVVTAAASGSGRSGRTPDAFRAPRPHEMRRERPELRYRLRERAVTLELPRDATREAKLELLAQAELEEREILELVELGVLED